MRLPQLKSRLRMAMTGARPHHPRAGALHQEIEKFGVTLCFAAGERIFAEGFHADRVYRIVSGFVRLTMRNPETQVVADFMLPGNWLGLFDRGEYGFSAEAATRVAVRSYLKHDAAPFFASVRGLVIMAEAKRQFSETVRYRTALPAQPAEERVRSFLHRMSQRLQIERREPLELPFSTHDIARHLGISDESVCRELTALNGAEAPIGSGEDKVLEFSRPESVAGRPVESDPSRQDRAVQLMVRETGAGMERSQSPALACANFAQAAVRCS